ncbi:hypothetical protein DL770_003543 [Monosporascus sp. CRB-9-2]|nr:hypothetical protein DL770_003543 [Monosporascus sp. CRB-9-2]
MAILEELPGVKVTVRVEGKDCVEYEDPDAADIQTSCPTSSKYIESVDDAEFCIHFHIDSDYNWDYKGHSLSMAVRVDNQHLENIIAQKANLINGKLEGDVSGRRVSCAETGVWLLRKPKFSAVNKEALRREMIIPRTPTQSPAIQDDFDSLSDAEKARLARERFQELQSIKKIKKEEPVTKRGFSEVFDLTNNDPPSRPIKRTAQVVDLTED